MKTVKIKYTCLACGLETNVEVKIPDHQAHHAVGKPLTLGVSKNDCLRCRTFERYRGCMCRDCEQARHREAARIEEIEDEKTL